MQLTAEHIYAYMPYGLRIKFNNTGNVRKVIVNYECKDEREISLSHLIFAIQLHNIGFKLLLRPVSELSENEIKEIALKERIHIKNVLRYIRMNIVSYRTIQMLLEQHYDVFGLIEHGLAEVK